MIDDSKRTLSANATICFPQREDKQIDNVLKRWHYNSRGHRANICVNTFSVYITKWYGPKSNIHFDRSFLYNENTWYSNVYRKLKMRK